MYIYVEQNGEQPAIQNEDNRSTYTVYYKELQINCIQYVKYFTWLHTLHVVRHQASSVKQCWNGFKFLINRFKYFEYQRVYICRQNRIPYVEIIGNCCKISFAMTMKNQINSLIRSGCVVMWYDVRFNHKHNTQQQIFQAKHRSEQFFVCTLLLLPLGTQWWWEAADL